jgi:outer membrane protein assembly factor BamD (BamD/ComL family)
MGRKRARTGKYLYPCIAGLIVFSLFGCAALEKEQPGTPGDKEVQHHLRQGQKLLAQGNYKEAARETEKALSLSGTHPPGDEALFTMGLIYVHPENPERSYFRSFGFFREMMQDYPQSSFFEQAKMWTGMLQEQERLDQEIEELNRQIEGLNRLIEESKEVHKIRMADKSKKTDAPPPKAVPKVEVKAEEETLLRAQKLLAKGDYEGAIRENEKVLSLSGNRPPGDEALFNMALIHAYSGNPKKDYGKSLRILKRLIKDYPQGVPAERAKVWIEILQEHEKLSQSVEELTRVIEKSKQVDIEIEEKKREKAK